MTRTRTCPNCMGPMEEKVQKKYLKDHGEPRFVAEASTFVYEWCSLTDYS